MGLFDQFLGNIFKDVNNDGKVDWKDIGHTALTKITGVNLTDGVDGQDLMKGGMFALLFKGLGSLLGGLFGKSGLQGNLLKFGLMIAIPALLINIFSSKPDFDQAASNNDPSLEADYSYEPEEQTLEIT